jgi:hypothetical protein
VEDKQNSIEFMKATLGFEIVPPFHGLAPSCCVLKFWNCVERDSHPELMRIRTLIEAEPCCEMATRQHARLGLERQSMATCYIQNTFSSAKDTKK